MWFHDLEGNAICYVLIGSLKEDVNRKSKVLSFCWILKTANYEVENNTNNS